LATPREPRLLLRASPALSLWRAEVASGVRTRATIDPLFRAACLESEALGWDRFGVPYMAAKCRAAACAVIVRAFDEGALHVVSAGRAA
jgi:hypothetical protein